MNAYGTGVRNVTNQVDSFNTKPTWSPDGSKTAFYSNRDGDNEIYVVRADGSGPQTDLTNAHASEDFGPAWSPDRGQDRVHEIVGRLHGRLRHERRRQLAGEPDVLRLRGTRSAEQLQHLRPRLEHLQYVDRQHRVEIAAEAGAVDRTWSISGEPFDKMPVLWPFVFKARRATRASGKASSWK